MKKVLLAAIGVAGLSGVLASCGTTAVISIGFAPGTQRSSTLTLDSMAYTTNYQTQSAFTDQNGNSIAAGSYVICDNLSTQMYVDLEWTGGLKNLYVQFKGLSTGATKTVPFYPFSGVDYSGSGTATYTLGAGTAPLSVSPKVGAQAIVVSPVIVNVKGNTYVNVQGTDQYGYNSNILTSAQALPVVNCQ
ncbi:hypothetical protein HNQ07_000924 [Deinococcus metalli]|uniref:Lipoprotein n=1 Tax=Deinococcus metalli TaxID=1141878 RepID=A0A7W8KCM1_9DEIO|nr:hypothetical protein [Deinococcus metalli]MBB5375480.1 hypothetical protein [Deinococcus metalli]GHF28962.1 hypothetical protein GCM10017781_01160 [Deinococcus metalli]